MYTSIPSQTEMLIKPLTAQHNGQSSVLENYIGSGSSKDPRMTYSTVLIFLPLGHIYLFMKTIL